MAWVLNLTLTDFRKLCHCDGLSAKARASLHSMYEDVVDNMEECELDNGESLSTHVALNINNDWED